MDLHSKSRHGSIGVRVQSGTRKSFVYRRKCDHERCAVPNCRTELSIYTPSIYCYRHGMLDGSSRHRRNPIDSSDLF